MAPASRITSGSVRTTVSQEIRAKVHPYYHHWQSTEMLVWDNWRMLHCVTGVDPKYMGMGPVPASKRCLARAGWEPKDLDLMEINEAFAAQAIAVNRQMGWDTKKVNVNGGAIALGHPIGASGAVLATKAVAELHRSAGRYALVTMCIGGGQGIAVVLERL